MSTKTSKNPTIGLLEKIIYNRNRLEKDDQDSRKPKYLFDPSSRNGIGSVLQDGKKSTTPKKRYTMCKSIKMEKQMSTGTIADYMKLRPESSQRSLKVNLNNS